MRISISGVHGIGKTTICELLYKRNGWKYIPETTDTTIKPPLIGPSGDAFKTEMWFLRHYLLRDRLYPAGNGETVVEDRWLNDVIIYSKAAKQSGILSEDDFVMLKDYYDNVYAHSTKPDLEIILYANETDVQKRIRKRMRKDSEKWGENDTNYLKLINNLFLDYYNSWRSLRRIELIDTSGLSVERTYRKCKSVIERYL